MNTPEQNRGGVRSAEDVVMGIVRRPMLLRDIRTETFLDGITFARLQLGDFVLQLLHEISEILPRAASYRNFPVAAGAWCKGHGQVYGRALGYNVKVDDTDLVNIHAEDQVHVKANGAKFTGISVFGVIGYPQEDHASGKLMDTLMPCGRCRGRLATSPLISLDTLFVMARPDLTVIQFAGLAAIQSAHGDGDYSGITTFRYPETPAIFRPRDMPDEWEYPTLPRSIEEVYSTDFDESIGLYLSQRYFESQKLG